MSHRLTCTLIICLAQYAWQEFKKSLYRIEESEDGNC
jgi:hypothetical protein